MSSEVKTSKVGLMAVCMILGLVVQMKPCNGETSLTVQCGTAIQQVTSCLEFATGKAAEPTKQCCTAVSSMKDKQPVCLCFFIGQAHNGSQQIKALGIQEAKLMELPSACLLKNANVTNCPKLLGISTTSPAAAIFMNNNMTASSGVTPSSSSSSTSKPADNSSGYKHGSGLLGGFLVVFASLLFASPVANLKSLY